jgi:hypothetical protein
MQTIIRCRLVLNTGMDGTGPESRPMAGLQLVVRNLWVLLPGSFSNRDFFFRKFISVFFSPQQTYTCSSTVWSGRLHQHEEILLFSNRNPVVQS